LVFGLTIGTKIAKRETIIMAQSGRPLPEYENPPVSEVALAIAFAPLANWRVAHGGLFWGTIQADYPVTQTQNPLPPQIERFGAAGLVQAPALAVEMVDPDTARFWYLSQTGNDLVQVQPDRFVVNWRKVTGEEVYPRYDAEMRPRLEREWNRFQQFINRQDIGPLVVQQCEVTYVNDILRGEGWESFSDAINLFSLPSGRFTEGFLEELETINIAGTFLMPEEYQGRLHFAIQKLRRSADQRELVQLRLTARGKPMSSDIDGALRWLDIGREWIVRGFTDLTSKEAHQLWRRTR